MTRSPSAAYRRMCSDDRPSGGIVLLAPRSAVAAGDADVVVVLEDGSVVEWGAPGDLLAASGVYARMVREQDALRSE